MNLCIIVTTFSLNFYDETKTGTYSNQNMSRTIKMNKLIQKNSGYMVSLLLFYKDGFNIKGLYAKKQKN